MIIILSSTDDLTADRVECELGLRSACYSRLDLSDFPQRVTASACLDGSGNWTGQIRHDDGWSVAWEDINAVYYRRPSNFDPAPSLTYAERRFAVAEARGGFGGVLASLDARWVNHPFRVADAEFKPIQLATAQGCGLAIPTTMITNNGPSARGFTEVYSQRVVYKPLGGGFYRNDNDEAALIYASLVTSESFHDAEIAATSHAFQSFVDKSHDVRVTVAGPHLFAAAIYSSSEAGRIDWRSDYNSLSYMETAAPNEIRCSINRYMDSFALLYGAFDFSIDRDGRWWFLECNPTDNGDSSLRPPGCQLPQLLSTC